MEDNIVMRVSKLFDTKIDALENKMSTLINTKVGALEKKLDERMDKLDERMDKLEERMDKLEEKISETDTKVTKLCERIDKLEYTVHQNSSTLKIVKSNVGHLYEMTLKSEISKKYGPKYSERFEIFDLYGAVRLALPKEKMSEEKMEYTSQAHVLDSRVSKLVDDIRDRDMRRVLEDNISYAENFLKTSDHTAEYKKNITNELLQVAKKLLKTLDSKEKIRDCLANTALGVMLLSSYTINPKVAFDYGLNPFYKNLEIDIRGKVFFYPSDSTLTIEIGEIKKSKHQKAIQKGYCQLLVRLAVLRHILQVVLPKNIKYQLFGKLFIPKHFSISPVHQWDRIVHSKECCTIIIEPIGQEID